MRPNFEHADVSVEAGRSNGKWEFRPSFETLASDGKTQWRVFPVDRNQESWPVGSNGLRTDLYLAEPLYGFFDPEQSPTANLTAFQTEGLLRSPVCLGVRHWNGNAYQVVRFVRQQVGLSDHRNFGLLHWFRSFDPPHRGLIDDGSAQFDTDLTDIRIDAPMTRASFAYRPPSDSKSPRRGRQTTKQGRNGAPAADFTVDARTKSPYGLRIIAAKSWSSISGRRGAETVPKRCLTRMQSRDGIGTRRSSYWL